MLTKHISQLNSYISIGTAPPAVIELTNFVEKIMMWIKDSEGRYKWVNAAFLLNFNLKDFKNIIGRTDFDLCSLSLANQYKNDDLQVLKGYAINARLELIGNHDHTARWCITHKIPLYDKNRLIIGTAGITQEVDVGDRVASEDSRLSQAILYISKNYSARLNNKQLAATCNMSLSVFERTFYNTYHVTVHSYIRDLRVRMSCSALVYTRKTLSQISLEYGFSDQSHFTKEFRRVNRDTPLAYRNKYKLK